MDETATGQKGIGNWWRVMGWGTAIALLAAPFIAMKLHANGVNWSPGDFVFAAVIFATVGWLLELAVKLTADGWYRGGVALSLLGALVVIWSNLAVGIVGSEHNPANLLFFAALLVGLVVAGGWRFRPAGMAFATALVAVALGAAFAIALMAPTNSPDANHATESEFVFAFAAVFLVAAALFHKSATRR